MFALDVVAQACAAPVTAPIVSYSAPPLSLVSSYGEHGTTQLIVTLGTTPGAPLDVRLVTSSGLPILDSAAIAQARHTEFAPETRDCAPVGGDYFYAIEY